MSPRQTTPSQCIFEPLIFVGTTNNHNVVLCKGKPESIEDDVQYYVFKCGHCNGEDLSQPHFYKVVKDGLDVMCGSCASKIGFKNVYHNNGSAKMVKGVYGDCTCSACNYQRGVSS